MPSPWIKAVKKTHEPRQSSHILPARIEAETDRVVINGIVRARLDTRLDG